jgi:hypothetical protein
MSSTLLQKRVVASLRWYHSSAKTEGENCFFTTDYFFATLCESSTWLKAGVRGTHGPINLMAINCLFHTRNQLVIDLHGLMFHVRFDPPEWSSTHHWITTLEVSTDYPAVPPCPKVMGRLRRANVTGVSKLAFLLRRGVCALLLLIDPTAGAY